jgi:hypothetical protein
VFAQWKFLVDFNLKLTLCGLILCNKICISWDFNRYTFSHVLKAASKQFFLKTIGLNASYCIANMTSKNKQNKENNNKNHLFGGWVCFVLTTTIE